MKRFVVAPLVALLVVFGLGVTSAGCALRGAIGGPPNIGSVPAPIPAPTPARGLTGPLQIRQESVRASMPPTNPSRVDQVGTPPLQTLQGG